MDQEEIVFADLAPKEVKYLIGGKKRMLREASADAVIRYRNACSRATKRDEDGKSFVTDGLADAEALLVSLCLCERNGDGKVAVGANGNAVTVGEGEIRAWPYHILSSIFEKVMEITPDLRDTEESVRRRIAYWQGRLKEMEAERKLTAAEQAKN